MISASTFLSGLGIGAGLIMAIGAQNLHVLRTGLRAEHVGLTVLACVTVDALLISLGVAGMGAAVQASPMLLAAARWGGAAFLVWYGLRSWRAVFASAAVNAGALGGRTSARQALASVLALSLLNPHVYLDTIVLLGAVGSSFPHAERPSFAGGAIVASLLWFSALGYGAARLSHVLARPVAWKWIDGIAGTTMLVLAVSVAMGE